MASREAYDFNGVRGHDSRNGTRRKAFIAGAVWAAARVTPTREQIAETMLRLVWPDVEFSPGECDLSDHYLEHADAILALIAGLAEGDS